MKRKAFVMVAALVLVPGTLLAQFAHPELKSGSRHVQKLMIMPIQVQLTKLGMKGTEPMTEESLQAQKSLMPVLADVFKTNGYVIDDTTVSPQVLERDDALRYSVDDLQKKLDEVLKIMARKPADVRRGRFTLGDEVVKLPAAENVDALLFVRVVGRIMTGGRKLYSFPMGDDVRMRMGVVDARTGDVLYYAEDQWMPDPAKNAAHASKHIRDAFKNFFKDSPPASATGKTQAQPTTPTDQ